MEQFFVQKDDVMTFPIENGDALHNLINDEYFSLEEGLSTMIWDSLDGSISVEGIIDMISDQYQMDKSIVEKDTKDFINNLFENGLIEKIDK